MEPCMYVFVSIYNIIYIYFLYRKERLKNLSEGIIASISNLHWKITPTEKTEKYKYKFIQKINMTR
jgi:hypothetical protein